ncbi:MAG: hypothetical protein H6922_00500 [Pseudomonadaceae bacterium]|nr:hypothetical protein [Pseudomonadaceae bacterium]
MRIACLLLGAAISMVGTSARADDWQAIGFVSSTLGVSTSRVCVGAPSANRDSDFGCAASAPYVDLATGNVGIGTTDPSRTLTIRKNHDGVLLQALSAPTTYYTEIINRHDSGEPFYILSQGIKVLGRKSMATTQETYVAGYYGLSFLTGSGSAPSAGNIRMYITNTGLVGVATTNPSTSLHVAGTIRIANGGEACDANRAGAIRYAGGTFEFCGGSSWQSISALAGYGDRIVSDTTSIVVNDGMDSISFTTAGSERMVVTSAGNVGIGTSSPIVKMHLAGSGPGLTLEDTNSGDPYPKIMLIDTWTTGTSNTSVIAADLRNTSGDFGSAPHGLMYRSGRPGLANHTFLEDDNTIQMVIRDGGNVGIGMAAPTAKLEVSGSIKIAQSGAETCASMADIGRIRVDPATGVAQICRK